MKGDEDFFTIRDRKAGDYDRKMLKTFREVVTACCKRSPSRRPIMNEVATSTLGCNKYTCNMQYNIFEGYYHVGICWSVRRQQVREQEDASHNCVVPGSVYLSHATNMLVLNFIANILIINNGSYSIHHSYISFYASSLMHLYNTFKCY